MDDEIYKFYNRLLLEDNTIAKKSFDYVVEEYKKEGIMMGEKILPFFLTPFFITEKQNKIIQKSSEKMMTILNKIGRYVIGNNSKLIDNLIYEDIRKIKNNSGFVNAINRMDFFLNGNDLKFIEFNSDSPSGAGRLDKIKMIFSSLEPVKRADKRFGLTAEEDMKSHLLEVLLEFYRNSGGKKEKPNILLIDWKDVKTISDQVIIADYLKSRGFDARLGDPRDIRYDGSHTLIGDFRIDIIYKRVIVKELIEKKEECSGLFKALSSGSLCMINPIESEIIGKKNLLSFVGMGKFNFILDADEIELVQKTIPWSREVISGKTENIDGDICNLEDYIRNNKDILVLKPDDGYGGEKVSIGNAISRSDWEETLSTALKSGGWIVQELIHVPEMEVVDLVNGKPFISKKYVNISSFVFGNKYGGCMTRVSEDKVINTSKTGGVIPTFVYKRG